MLPMQARGSSRKHVTKPFTQPAAPDCTQVSYQNKGGGVKSPKHCADVICVSPLEVVACVLSRLVAVGCAVAVVVRDALLLVHRSVGQLLDIMVRR